MPISPPDEKLLDLPSIELMELFGRIRYLTDKAGFSGTLPAIWQCSDESQSIKKALFGYVFNCPSFNLGRVGALLDPTRLATAAHHGNDLVIIGGSHLGAQQEDGIGYIERIHGDVAPCCGKLTRVLGEYLQLYQRATQLIKIFRAGGTARIEIPYKYLFSKPRSSTARIQIRLNRLVGGESTGEGSLGKIFPMNHALITDHPALGELTETPQPIGKRLTPDTFSFRKNLDHDSLEPLSMLEASVFDFFPEIVSSNQPHRRICDINTWRQFHRMASYITDYFDGSHRNIFVLAGLTIDHSVRHNSFVPQFGFWMEQGKALEARYFNTEQIHELLSKQKIYRPPVTFLEYAGIT
ncbi:MAG: hypothetical protein P1P74_11990 [Desulfuromonadales bacterium]|nr:hypothetical protein [Desulfuromonadales bacterium]